ncbi:MAG TPA: SCO family protein [Gammaproteobacteria bacterium]|nr:SCO family protein [Gammaproteobacteria bacterium]
MKPARTHLYIGALTALLCAPDAFVGPARADEDPHAHHRPRAAVVDRLGGAVGIAIPDAELVTQNGAAVRLATDVVGDKIVVMDFVYTTCTTVCPVLSAIFSQVQTSLAERLGQDVAIVSISVDPARDTPAALRDYSARHGAREGWTWLTGAKPVVDKVLQQLGAYTPNFEDHPSMVLVGDGRTGQWVRFLGFPGAEQIMDKIDEFSAARADGHPSGRVRGE